MTLPALIPIFPLPNAVLFPGVSLPLHTFEPRYRQMVRDLQGDKEALIGVVLLSGDWQSNYYGDPAVYQTGCAGRVVGIEELKDGRFNILLHGLREFEIEREDRSRPYRQAHPRWRPPAGDVQVPALRSRLLDLARRFLSDRKREAVPALLRDPSVPDELFVNLLCFALHFPPLEKQALLEAPSVVERATRLCDAVRFTLETDGLGVPDRDRYH